jgi:hypothetical protein
MGGGLAGWLTGLQHLVFLRVQEKLEEVRFLDFL